MKTLVLFATWLGFAACAVAQGPQPFVRARFEPAERAVVGQPVRVIVEVLVPNYFTSGTNFPELEIKNAIVVAPQETPQNFSERVSGTAFAGIRQVYTVYPEVAGNFRLPPVPVGVNYADEPPHSAQVSVALPPLSFHASIPEAAQGLSYFLPTTKAVLTEDWTPSLKRLHTGETIERTITITADKLQGMLIPPVLLDAPDGVRLYLEQPVVQDEKSDRGEFIGGRRVQTARYLIQKPGEYALPAIELKWWDFNSGRVRTETLPAVHFTAIADPNYAPPELPPAVEPAIVPQKNAASPWKRIWLLARASWIWIFGVIVFLWFAARTLPDLVRWIGRRREQLRASEGAYFRKLTSACQRNHAADSYVWLLRWLERSQPGVPLEDYLNASADGPLRTLVAELGAGLYSPEKAGNWNGTELAAALKRHRRTIRARTKPGFMLPALNPLAKSVSTSHKA